MAEPTILLKYNDNTEGSPNWVTIGAAEKITFTGSGSSDQDMKNVIRPTGSNKIRIDDECWIQNGTDIVLPLYEAGGDEVSDYVSDIFVTSLTNTNYFAIQADTNPEAQAGELEAWDDNTYATYAEEWLSAAGVIGAHSQLRAGETSSNVAPGAGAGSLPGGYDSQTGQTTTFQLQGDNRSITFTTALAAGNQNRFVLHSFTLDDSPAGVQNIYITYKYYYT